MPELYEHQKKALLNMHNGCILAGGVGSGKSRTALEYYRRNNSNLKLYIITTAKKRDEMEWEEEMLCFHDMHAEKVDSWNNIKKYSEVTDAFFIFDEDRITGKGAWVKAFLKIAKSNNWIVLSATPGDTWEDYIPIFIANGFYRNRTDFCQKHVVWNRYTAFPKIEGYVHTGYLNGLRRRILVPMDFERQTRRHHEDIYCSYSIADYKKVLKDRWNVFKNEPLQNASALCYTLRRVVNSDSSRLSKVYEIAERSRKVIVFYNYDYELALLKSLFENLSKELPEESSWAVAEWNGHRHQEIPVESKQWIYLVQYGSGSEGWNCVLTDTIIFYSQSYSYKQTEQAAGRIDRLNTPFVDLYYYHLKSYSSIDISINRALKDKKNFNETAWVKSNSYS